MDKSLLSNSDARTIRHARIALGLLISGAYRDLESNFGPSDDPDRTIATDALLLHLREELDGYMTTAETGDRPTELSVAETSLPPETGETDPE